MSKGNFRYFFVIIVSVEGTFLLALLAVDRRPVLKLRVSAALALVAYKRGDHVAVLTGGRLAICLNVLFALFAYRASAALGRLLELRTAIGALYHRKSSAAFLENRQ